MMELCPQRFFGMNLMPSSEIRINPSERGLPKHPCLAQSFLVHSLHSSARESPRIQNCIVSNYLLGCEIYSALRVERVAAVDVFFENRVCIVWMMET